MLNKIIANLKAGHRYYNRDTEKYMDNALDIYHAIIELGEWVEDVDAPIIHHKPAVLKMPALI